MTLLQTLRFVVLFVPALAAGCAGASPWTRIDNSLQSWVGLHVDDLVGTWGVPQGRHPLSNGGAVISYSSSSVRSSTSICITSDCKPTTSVYSLACTLNFTINPDGIVTSYSYDGQLGECQGMVHVAPSNIPPRAARMALAAPHPHLGLIVAFLNEAIAKEHGVRAARGVLIGCHGESRTPIKSGSPATTVDLQAGDVITEVDGRSMDREAFRQVMSRTQDLAEYFSGRQAFFFGSKQVGDSLELSVLRGAKKFRIKVTLTEFRWPRDVDKEMRERWAGVPHEPDGTVRYWSTDPRFLFVNNFVDPDRCSYAQWESLFVPFRQADGSFRLTEPQFLTLGQCRPQYILCEYEPRGRVKEQLATHYPQSDVEKDLNCGTF